MTDEDDNIDDYFINEYFKWVKTLPENQKKIELKKIEKILTEPSPFFTILKKR